MSSKSVILLNGAKKSSGIGRYSQITYEAIQDVAELISMAFSREDYDAGLPGNVITGLFPPVTSGWFINTNFQTLVYRKLLKHCKRTQERGGIIHYTDPYIKQLSGDGRSLVNIYDLFPLANENWSPPMWKKYAAKCLNEFKRAENILTSSNKSKKEIEENGFNGKVHMIYPYVALPFRKEINKEQARDILGLPREKKLILTVSSKSGRKNLSLIKEIVSSLSDDFLLLRVGSDIGTGKTFVNIDDETLNLIYRSSDVLLFPTKDEGFGFPIIEALATGLPIVTTELEITTEIAGKTAVFMENTVMSGISSVNEALNSADSLSRSGRERAKLFQKDIFRSELLECYSKIR